MSPETPAGQHIYQPGDPDPYRDALLAGFHMHKHLARPSRMFTRIRSVVPERVCKAYSLDADGNLTKTAVAAVTEGVAHCRDVPDAAALVHLLQAVTERPDIALCPGGFHGAGAAPFHLVPEARLAELVGSTVGAVRGGIHAVGGRRIAARLKRGIAPSSWLLLDADNPPGIPDAWAAMPIAQRLAFLEPVIPGLAACERIELRGSSARVHRLGEQPGERSHAWIRVSDPEKIATLKAHVTVAMVTAGLSFASPRYSRIEPDKVIGHQHRTVVDLAVWDVGRLVFAARPDVSEAPGFVVADAGICIVNEGGGALDISAMTLPEPDALDAYYDRTGIDMEIRDTGAGLVIRTTGELTMDTEIEVRGRVRTLAAWCASMRPGDKLRCETPFRASQSEAGVIRILADGRPCLHDVGSGVTHLLAPDPDHLALRRELAARILADLRRGATPQAIHAAAIGPVTRAGITEHELDRVLGWAVKNHTAHKEAAR